MFPNGKKEKNFAKHQEASCKGVKRAFGILQALWEIIKQPSQLWDQKELHYIMKACIIMHNMIVEDERESIFENDLNYDHINPPNTNFASGSSSDFQFFLQRYQAIRNQHMHSQLKNDLIEHQWSLHQRRLQAKENMAGGDGNEEDNHA